MKKLFIFLSALLLGFNSFADSLNRIDEKIITSFYARFPNAREVKWFESTAAYEVSFFDNDIPVRILYQKDGSTVVYTRYYKDQLLPYPIHYMLAKQFPDKTVYSVAEVSTVYEPWNQVSLEYFITLEDGKRWVNIKVGSDGVINVLEKLKKAEN
jgi:hypothetical protein